jgi:plastocyanin
VKNTILLGVLVASLIAITSFDNAFAQTPTEIDIKFDIGSSVPGCELSNSCFNPSLLFVDVGETITWYNADTAIITVTSGTPTGGLDQNFDSGFIMPGNTFSVTLTQPGTYTYYSMVHPWAIGEIIVQGSGTSVFDIEYNDLLYKITGYEKDHIYFSKYYEDGVHMSTYTNTINEFNGGDTWIPLYFGIEGQDAVLEWKWYYDENYSIELDSITWNRAYATTGPTPISTNFIDAINSGYTPNTAITTVGDVVTFYNSDTQSHTFTSGTPADGPNGKFNSGLLIPGESSEFSSDVSGNFQYYCTLHPWMVGMLMVEHSDFTKPSSISVFTDDISYDKRDHIEIYGAITKSTGPTFVRINVATTDGFTVYNSITSMNFVGDHTFDRTVIPDERLWREGTYVVTASYGSEYPEDYLAYNIFATTSFYFTGFAKTSVDYETYNYEPETDFDPIPETDFDPIPETDFDPIPETDLDSLLEQIDESETNDNQDDSQENDSYSAQHLLNQEQKKISITKQLDPQTQNKVKTLDSKITREQTQYEEYLKQYDYYEGKTLSPKDAKKFQIITGKLDTQSEKIDSLIDKRNTIIFESKDVSKSIEYNSEPKFYSELPSKLIEDKAEPIEDKVVPPQRAKIEVKIQKDPTCFLFWCW